MAKAWCNHYRGMHESKACEAGVRFQELPTYGEKGFMDRCPCFGPQAVSICDKARYPTKEELASREAEIQKRFEGVIVARQAIVESLGGPWKRGVEGSNGVIDCPVCSAGKSLQFRRAGYNGHIHARCKTDDCVSWME